MERQGIIRHPFKSVEIRKLKLPGDMERRRKQQHVIDLATSFEATGGQPAEPPIVEWVTWRLIAGADRIAACLNRGIKEVDVLMVEGEPEALEALQLIENVHRRNSGEERDAGIKRLLELAGRAERETTLPEGATENLGNNSLPKPDATQPKKEAGKRLAAVAAQTGRTKAAVKQAAYRANKAGSPGTPDERADPPPVIESMGLVIPEDIRQQTALEHAGLTALHGRLVILQGDLTRLEGKVGHQYQALKEALHDAAFRAKQDQPASVCPWCKLTPLRDSCRGCRGRGWLTVGEMEACDERLLAQGDKMGVYSGGKWLTLAEAEQLGCGGLDSSTAVEEGCECDD